MKKQIEFCKALDDNKTNPWLVKDRICEQN